MMVSQRSLLEFMVIRNSPPGLSSYGPKFSPSAPLCLINVRLEHVLKEQGIALKPLANVILFHFENQHFLHDYCLPLR